MFEIKQPNKKAHFTVIPLNLMIVIVPKKGTPALTGCFSFFFLPSLPQKIALLQFPLSWYGMGKTSVESRLNLPGRVAWMLMEAPGFMALLYMMKTLPRMHGIEDLPWQNRVLAGLFVRVVECFILFISFFSFLFLPSYWFPLTKEKEKR